MITIINFSHPILQSDTIAQLIGNPYGYEVIDIPVNLYLNQPLAPQIEQLVDAALVAVNFNIRRIDLIRLPDLAEVAALIVNEFQARGYVPGILRFTPVAGTTPRRFEAVEIIQVKLSREVAK